VTTEDIRSYHLSYPIASLWLDLCEPCVAKRLSKGASVLDKRTPVTASECSDCKHKQLKGR